MEHNRVLFKLIKKHKWDDFSSYLEKFDDIDVNIRDESNNYLIHYAIIFNHIDTVSLLIHKGSRLDITDGEGRTILYAPIKYNYMDILELLLHFNKTNVGISLVDITDNKGNIPLHYGIKSKNIKAMKVLLKSGSNVNAVDGELNNAIHMAVYTRVVEICKLILEQDININAKTRTGETALHIACNFQLSDIVRILLKANIDTDVQDYDNEFTALHYAVNLNSIVITKLLIESGANVNVQDFLGNTAIHYAVLEKNFEIMNHIIQATKNVVNINLYNIDSKLPIHIYFEQGNENKLATDLIQNSNLNFKDNNGTSAMHHISKNNIWKKYIDILSKKKIDVFSPNNNDVRPIDSVDDVSIYINMVTDSYLYVLANHNFIWKESWENVCKAEMFANKLTKEEFDILNKHTDIKKIKHGENVCKSIVHKKLMTIYKTGSRCGYSSYPVKKNSKCISIPESNRVEFCTFTGITLDILMGLIHLLKTHGTACSTLTTDFMENKKLCEYYESIGIVTNTKCEFLNFEVVWVYQKLYLTTNFVKIFKKCVKNRKKKYVIVPLGIELRQGSHANYLIYDKQSKEVERFEPYGSYGPYKFYYNPNLLDEVLAYRFSQIDPEIKYYRPGSYMPKIGFQYMDIMESKKKKIGDPGGFCAIWSIWYTDMRLTYPDISRKKLVKKMMKSIKEKNRSFKNMIRNYSLKILSLREGIFGKAKLTINDWINDQYTEKQLIKVIQEITALINKYT